MSWHALFAKEHTEQLLWASIIRKCNKIRQTDYISELGSKIKTQFGEGFNYGGCARLFEHQPLNHFTVVMLGHKFAVCVCVYMIIEVSSHECFCVHLSSPADAMREFFSMFVYFPCSCWKEGCCCWWWGGGQPVATYTGSQPATDTNLVLANGCSNHFRLRRQLVSNRG